MHIVIVGGTGFIGRALTEALLAAGWRVTVATRRSPAQASRVLPSGAAVLSWNAPGGLALPPGTDAVVNLAGASIARRWTQAAKRLILESRVGTTRAVVAALAAASARPRVLVNASAVGYYGRRGDEIVTEADGPGQDFLASVCRQWEAAAKEAEAAGIRVVLLRTGFVVGRGGAMRLMLLPYRLFLGGPLGSGQQWLPWIHLDDVVGLIRFALENEALQGPVNLTAPEPVRQEVFARALGRAMGRPAWLRTPEWALRTALGEMADMLLTGQRAVPAAALAAGYTFRRPDLDEALRSVAAH